MRSLVKTAKAFIIPKVIVDTLRNQDPKILGLDSAKTIKRVIANEIGVKGYQDMWETIISWLDAFYVAFRKELYGN